MTRKRRSFTPEYKAEVVGLVRETGEIANQLIEPASDYHADEAYRRDLMRTLPRRALVEARERCG